MKSCHEVFQQTQLFVGSAAGFSAAYYRLNANNKRGAPPTCKERCAEG
jgi:hypothetical protein